MKNFDRREKNPKEYISIFYPELKYSLNECDVLDVGCGSGRFSLLLSDNVHTVVGYDIDKRRIGIAKERAGNRNSTNVTFTTKREEIKGLFHIVLLSDVIEHVSHPKEIINFALSHLKEDGVLYINTPNKWFPIEAHKKLPFLSWLPEGIARKYSKLFGKGDYPRSQFHLFSFNSFTKLLEEMKLHYTLKPIKGRLLYRIFYPVVTNIPIIWKFSPAFQVIATNKKVGDLHV